MDHSNRRRRSTNGTTSFGSYQVRFYGSLGSLNVSFWRQSGLRKSEKLRRIKDHSNSVSSFPGALTKLRYPPERYGFVVPALPVATSNVRFFFCVPCRVIWPRDAIQFTERTRIRKKQWPVGRCTYKVGHRAKPCYVAAFQSHSSSLCIPARTSPIE